MSVLLWYEANVSVCASGAISDHSSKNAMSAFRYEIMNSNADIANNIELDDNLRIISVHDSYQLATTSEYVSRNFQGLSRNNPPPPSTPSSSNTTALSPMSTNRQ